MKILNLMPLFFLLFYCSINFAFSQNLGKSNIIIILTDDQGWADVGFNGSRDIFTPNIDRLAKTGVKFTNGYVTHPYCSPSRAGILTGRYQQRFGHENNVPYEPDNPAYGTPIDEIFLSRVLKKNGYTTAAIGKWHLGDHEKFWPTNRGFDYWFGFTRGGMSYWGETGNRGSMAGVLRNGKVVPKEEISYLTDDFTNEAVKFIQKNNKTPFFLYLAYNAPHGPNHVTSKYLKETEHIEYGDRSVYAAMIGAIDNGVGKIQNVLKKENLEENTLIIFLSDNGGRYPVGNNKPYRGHKGMLFEGGIRVPFTMTWPGEIKSGLQYENPVSALDIFPTALAAAGIEAPKRLELDGINLVPFLSSTSEKIPHEKLFWSYSGGIGYAVRKGKYKLVRSEYKRKRLLFDIKNDEMELFNLADSLPNIVNELQQEYDEWENEMIRPRWWDPHIENVHREEESVQSTREEASRGERQ